MSTAGAAASRPFTPEQELALRLCAVRSRRDAERRVVERLGREVDVGRLAAFLAEQRVVALAGTRLAALLPGELPDSFQREVDEHLSHNRHRGMLFDQLSREACDGLEAHGIRTVLLKGASLAERAYGDLGLRSAQSDIDLLVSPELLGGAIEVLGRMGYAVDDDVDWHEGLPHYHARLVRNDPVEVWVEVHWRLHWYEERFAEEMLGRSGTDANGSRILRPADELAALLLMFARDGYTGLRAPADIAVWWDRFADDLPPVPMNGVVDAHGPLAGAVIAAADVLEREVGLPAARLVDGATGRTKRTRLASRLAGWNASEEEDATNVALNDLLLTPPGAYRTYLRHYFWQPTAHYRRVYGWPPEQVARNQARRAIHASARLARTSLRFARRVWQLRGGVEWAPVP